MTKHYDISGISSNVQLGKTGPVLSNSNGAVHINGRNAFSVSSGIWTPLELGTTGHVDPASYPVVRNGLSFEVSGLGANKHLKTAFGGYVADGDVVRFDDLGVLADIISNRPTYLDYGVPPTVTNSVAQPFVTYVNSESWYSTFTPPGSNTTNTGPYLQVPNLDALPTTPPIYSSWVINGKINVPETQGGFIAAYPISQKTGNRYMSIDVEVLSEMSIGQHLGIYNIAGSMDVVTNVTPLVEPGDSFGLYTPYIVLNRSNGMFGGHNYELVFGSLVNSLPTDTIYIGTSFDITVFLNRYTLGEISAIITVPANTYTWTSLVAYLNTQLPAGITAYFGVRDSNKHAIISLHTIGTNSIDVEGVSNIPALTGTGIAISPEEYVVQYDVYCYSVFMYVVNTVTNIPNIVFVAIQDPNTSGTLYYNVVPDISSMPTKITCLISENTAANRSEYRLLIDGNIAPLYTQSLSTVPYAESARYSDQSYISLFNTAKSDNANTAYSIDMCVADPAAETLGYVKMHTPTTNNPNDLNTTINISVPASVSSQDMKPGVFNKLTYDMIINGDHYKANDVIYVSKTGAEIDKILTQKTASEINAAGTNYVVVSGADTPLNNANELQAKYTTAKSVTGLSALNRYTVIVAPGQYRFASDFVVDTQFIDIVSMTGNCDVDFTFTHTANNLMVMSNNVAIKGINTDTSSFIVGDNLDGLVVEKCKGGNRSFGSDCNASGTFIDCVAGYGSFGGSMSGFAGQASGTFIGCVAGNGSFGYCDGSGGYGYGLNPINPAASGTFTNCTAGSYSFGTNGTASGKFNSCTADSYSFGFDATGVFTNCTANEYSFGASSLTGVVKYCTLLSGTYTTPTASGKIMLSIDSTGVVGVPSSGGIVRDNTPISWHFVAQSNTWYTDVSVAYGKFSIIVTAPTSPLIDDEVWITHTGWMQPPDLSSFGVYGNNVGTTVKLKYTSVGWQQYSEQLPGQTITGYEGYVRNDNFSASAGMKYLVGSFMGKFPVYVSGTYPWVWGDEIIFESVAGIPPDLSTFGVTMDPFSIVRLKYFPTGWTKV